MLVADHFFDKPSDPFVNEAVGIVYFVHRRHSRFFVGWFDKNRDRPSDRFLKTGH